MSYTTPEKRVQKKITEFLDQEIINGAPIYYQRRDATGRNYKAGLPDLYMVYNGIHVEIEVKRPDGEMKSDQERWKRRFEAVHIIHLCPHTFQEFLDSYNEIKGAL